MRPFSRWRDKLAAWRRSRRTVVRTAITHDPLRLVVTSTWSDGSDSVLTFNWRDVNRVTAYKRDLYVTDLICLAISTAETAIEINEEMQGWQSLMETLPGY